MVLGDVRVVLTRSLSHFFFIMHESEKGAIRTYHCLLQVLCFPQHTVSSLAEAYIFRRGVLSRQADNELLNGPVDYCRITTCFADCGSEQ